MVATLQKIITLSLMALATGWLVSFHVTAPVLAMAGFVVIAFGYILVLGLEFLLMRRINHADTAPRATWRELSRAWWGEITAAPKVFCWQQPFRTFAVPDNIAPACVTQGQRGVVFLHGMFCNRAFWNPWMSRLAGSGHAFVAVSMEPLFGSIDSYTLQVDFAVRQVTEATGLPPLLVCHSMGGLAARAWLKAMRAENRVHHVVTIGTPHRGTWLARFSHGHNGRQMRLLSGWTTSLTDGIPAARHSMFTCWFSNTDNIVFPASTASLPQADNRLLRGAAHVQMAFLPQVMNETLKMLERVV